MSEPSKAAKRIAECIQATWRISLSCYCPACQDYVDLLDDADFWDGRELKPCEHDTKASTEVDVVCPSCGHEFKIDCTY